VVVRDCRRSSTERYFRKRGLLQIAQQNEAPPAESFFPLEDGDSGESCYGGIRICRREGNFPKSKLSGVCSGGIRKYAPQETVFLFRRYSIHADHHVGIDQLLSCSFYFPLSKIEYCRRKSRAKAQPDGRHFEKIRV
jgi:hypothetical protein